MPHWQSCVVASLAWLCFVLDCATLVVAQTAVADCAALAQTQWAPLLGWQTTLSPAWCCNSNATGVTCTFYNGSYNVTGLQLSGRNLTGAFHFSCLCGVGFVHVENESAGAVCRTDSGTESGFKSRAVFTHH